MSTSPTTPAASSPSWHQSTKSPTVTSSSSAGMTIESSGSATSSPRHEETGPRDRRRWCPAQRPRRPELWRTAMLGRTLASAHDSRAKRQPPEPRRRSLRYRQCGVCPVSTLAQRPGTFIREPRRSATRKQTRGSTSRSQAARLGTICSWVATLCAPYLGASVLEVGAGRGSVTQHQRRRPTRRRNRSLGIVRRGDAKAICGLAERGGLPGRPPHMGPGSDVRFAPHGERARTHSRRRRCARIASAFCPPRGVNRHLRTSNERPVREVGRLHVRHFRRYSKWRLREVIRQASLDPVELRYANMIAMPAWVLFSMLMRFDADGRNSLSIWDRTIVPATRMLESRMRVPSA